MGYFHDAAKLLVPSITEIEGIAGSKSLPTRERGLKLKFGLFGILKVSRSPRGSVD